MKDLLSADLRVFVDLCTASRVVSLDERRPVREDLCRVKHDDKYEGAVPFTHFVKSELTATNNYVFCWNTLMSYGIHQPPLNNPTCWRVSIDANIWKLKSVRILSSECRRHSPIAGGVQGPALGPRRGPGAAPPEALGF